MMTAQWTASFSFTTTKNGSPIRKLTPSPYIFVRYFEKRYTPSWIKPEDGAHTRRARQRRPTSAFYDEFISALCASMHRHKVRDVPLKDEGRGRHAFLPEISNDLLCDY
jgi:hypothetical protein